MSSGVAGTLSGKEDEPSQVHPMTVIEGEDSLDGIDSDIHVGDVGARCGAYGLLALEHVDGDVATGVYHRGLEGEEAHAQLDVVEEPSAEQPAAGTAKQVGASHIALSGKRGVHQVVVHYILDDEALACLNRPAVMYHVPADDVGIGVCLGDSHCSLDVVGTHSVVAVEKHGPGGVNSLQSEIASGASARLSFAQQGE